MEPLKAFWHWNEHTTSIDEVIALTKETGGNAVILKAAYQSPIYSTNVIRRADFPGSARRVKEAGLMLLAEIYCIPGAWAAEADALRWAVEKHGACAVVLNMEGPYEAEPTGDNVENLLARFGRLRPIWASTDFRGNRLALPFHQALARHVAGWMPMIYPGAFYPDTPWGDLQRAFDDAYWSWIRHKDSLHPRGRAAPIIPAIQSYGGMDYEEMVGQITLAWRWTKVLNKKDHGTSIYAAHDCNVRAKWGVRDGWEIIEDALRQMEQPDWEQVANRAANAASTAAGEAAYEAVTRFSKE